MTIHPAGTRGDALRVELAAVEVPMLAVAGAIPGTVITASGGFNGPGGGTIRQLAASRNIQWKAPGSSSYGTAIDVAAGGSFVLEDGDDPAAWVRVLVAPTFQASGDQDAIAHIQDVFNSVGQDDVTEAEALAGDVTAFTLDLVNQSGMEVVGVVAWIDPATVGMEISDDGVVWVTPTTEGAGLSLGNVAIGATVVFHFRRTIGASAPSDPDVLNLFHLSWTGL